MNVKDLLEILNTADIDAEIVVQRNHEGGYISLHEIQVWKDGHTGYSGPIIMIGENIDNKAVSETKP